MVLFLSEGSLELYRTFRLSMPVEKIESKWEKLFIYLLIDLQKTFDRIPREILWLPIRKLGVEKWLIQTVQAMYTKTKSSVRVNLVRGLMLPGCLPGVCSQSAFVHHYNGGFVSRVSHKLPLAPWNSSTLMISWLLPRPKKSCKKSLACGKPTLNQKAVVYSKSKHQKD